MGLRSSCLPYTPDQLYLFTETTKSKKRHYYLLTPILGRPRLRPGNIQDMLHHVEDTVEEAHQQGAQEDRHNEDQNYRAKDQATGEIIPVQNWTIANKKCCEINASP